MRFICRKNVSVERSDYCDFVAKWHVDITEYEKDGPAEFVIGRIFAKEILVNEAEVRGFSLAEIADADSAELEGAYAMLCDWEGNLREGDLDHFTGNIVLIEAYVLHPKYSSWQKFVVDRFGELFECGSILMMEYPDPTLSDKDFAAMGFNHDDQNVAPVKYRDGDFDRSTEYMFRNTALKNATDGKGDPKPVYAKEEYEDWVEKQVDWKLLHFDD